MEPELTGSERNEKLDKARAHLEAAIRLVEEVVRGTGIEPYANIRILPRLENCIEGDPTSIETIRSELVGDEWFSVPVSSDRVILTEMLNSVGQSLYDEEEWDTNELPHVERRDGTPALVFVEGANREAVLRAFYAHADYWLMHMADDAESPLGERERIMTRRAVTQFIERVKGAAAVPA
ncbi:MAG: hypothetical protein JW910_18045 [Anaerolineae bacterium]|nr:hypothetical protein [Anaerolineae bacterium]